MSDYPEVDRRENMRRDMDACRMDCTTKWMALEKQVSMNQYGDSIKLAHIEKYLETLVTHAQFTPVKLVVYGAVMGLCGGVGEQVMHHVFG